MIDLHSPFFAIFFFICPLVGDYCLQSDWMAQAKTGRGKEALYAVTTHALVYTACFLVLTFDWRALAVIGGTHWLIDHFRLARYVSWAKNFLAPSLSLRGSPVLPEDRDIDKEYEAIQGEAKYLEVKRWHHSWEDCKGTGYHKDTPAWLAVWLMTITDNTMHFVINAAALWYFVS